MTQAPGDLEAQLFRYAEDLHLLMNEHDALQRRYRALEMSYRSVAEYRDLLSTLMQASGEAYIATNTNQQILTCTPNAGIFCGTEMLIGLNLMTLCTEESREHLQSLIDQTDPGLPDYCPIVFHTPDEQERHAIVRLLRDPMGGSRHERRHWILRSPGHSSLPPQPGIPDLVFEKSSQAIFITDANGVIQAVNPAFNRITGYAVEEVIGKTPRMLKSGMQPAHFYRIMWEQLRHQGSWQGEIQNRRKNGELYPEWLVINAARDHDGHICSYVGIFHDLTQLQASERQLSRLAYHDILTGLPNRQLFNDRLRMALHQARRDRNRMGLCFIDLDRFKQINDTLGHDAGDELLKAVAERLRKVTRQVDTVARLGGDEFTIILPGLCDPQDAITAATKILETFQAPILVGQHELFAAPSIGITLYPDHGEEEHILLRRADAAMYRAKAEGGNTFHLFELEDEESHSTLSMESALRQAISHDEFHLAYQPQVSADSTRLLGVEALLRWRSAEFGDVAPDVFIPIAERTGMIIEIGQWVLHEACAQIARWQASGLMIPRVGVNVSPRQLRAPNFADTVLSALARQDLPGDVLELEITESELMLYPASTLMKLGELRSHGVSIAIDDFGTGYSSLARLNTLPVDRIKVDRSFVRDLGHSDDAQAISACIVTLARVMKLEVIAEGVENTEQLDQLLNQGCHSIQGFLFARPMSPDAVADWKSAAQLQ